MQTKGHVCELEFEQETVDEFTRSRRIGIYDSTNNDTLIKLFEIMKEFDSNTVFEIECFLTEREKLEFLAKLIKHTKSNIKIIFLDNNYLSFDRTFFDEVAGEIIDESENIKYTYSRIRNSNSLSELVLKREDFNGYAFISTGTCIGLPTKVEYITRDYLSINLRFYEKGEKDCVYFSIDSFININNRKTIDDIMEIIMKYKDYTIHLNLYHVYFIGDTSEYFTDTLIANNLKIKSLTIKDRLRPFEKTKQDYKKMLEYVGKFQGDLSTGKIFEIKKGN